MSFDSLNSNLDLGSAGYQGKYFLGKVVKNDDPKNLGRIQADVPGLFDSVNGDVPWAGPVKYSSFGQGKTWGVYGSPEVGSDVIILLQDGNPHYPLYHTLQAHANEDFESGGKAWGFVDPYGNKFLVQKDKTITFTAVAGVTIKITPAGAVIITTASDLTANIGGNVNIAASGTMAISSGGNMSFTAPRIDWNS
jgi:hypothetical protein